mgnify:CR=1 FL=1
MKMNGDLKHISTPFSNIQAKPNTKIIFNANPCNASQSILIMKKTII